MVFLADFTHVHSDPFTLLDVQNAVFEHFADLRVSSGEFAAKPLHDAVETVAQEESRPCVCNLIPNVNITPEDLARYRRLLTSVSSSSSSDLPNQKSGGTGKRKKPSRLEELQKVHERITKAQLAIQKRLLSCEPCAHSVLSFESESTLLEFLSQRQTLRWNKLPRPVYMLYEQIENLASSATSIQHRSTETHGIHTLIVPVAGAIHFTHSEEFKRWMSLNAKQNSSTVTYTPTSVEDRVVVLPESVFTMLFAQTPSQGVCIPFTVSEVASTNKKKCRKLQLEDVVWSFLPEPRERARLFFDCATQFHCYRYEEEQQQEQREQPPPNTSTGTPRNQRVTSSPSSRTPTPRKPVSVGPISEEKQKTHGRKSARIAGRSKQTESTETTAKSVEKTEELPRSTPHTPRSNSKDHTTISQRNHSTHTVSESPARRSQRRFAASVNSQTARLDSTHRENSDEETEAETEAGNLSIDITPLEEEVTTTDFTTDLSTLRQEVASICTVVTPAVTRARLLNHGKLTDISGPTSPSCDAPASPSSSIADDLLASATADPNKSPVTRVIPLEPIQSTPRTSPSPASPIRQPSSDFTMTTDLSAVLPGRSFARLELGQKTVLVQYNHTVWSPERSCLACCSSEPEPSGHCSLWPSCSSLRERWADHQHKLSESKVNNLRPVYVQIKPEYLGDWGCEVLSPYELAEAWLGSVVRNKADIVRVRVRVDSGEIVWVEYQPLDDMLSSNPNFKPELNTGFVSALFDKLLSLSPGSYVLFQNNPSSYKVFKSADERELPNGSKSPEFDPSTVLDLLNELQRFRSLSSSVSSLLEDSSTIGDAVALSNTACLTVERAMLDLNLPAGLEPKSANLGRALRLPALPASRISQPKRDSVNAEATGRRPEEAPLKRPKPGETKKSSNHKKVCLDKSKLPQAQITHSRRTRRTGSKKNEQRKK